MSTSLGERLRKLRTEAGLTQFGLAKLAEVDTSSISRIERGEATSPSGALISKLAVALNVSADRLLRDDESSGRRVRKAAAS